MIVPIVKGLLELDTKTDKDELPGWMIMKSYLCGYTGIFLAALALTNPSSSMIFSIFLIPLIILAKPGRYLIYVILLIISPPLLMFDVDFFNQSWVYYTVHGNVFLPIVFLGYYPIVTTCQILTTFKEFSSPSDKIKKD